ncbi:hypothetical protein MRX96_020701 [Rhipicephalus microplus]
MSLVSETWSETICHVGAQAFRPNVAGPSPLFVRSGQLSTAGQTVGLYSVMRPRVEKSSTEQPEFLPRTTANISALQLCQIERTRQR